MDSPSLPSLTTRRQYLRTLALIGGALGPAGRLLAARAPFERKKTILVATTRQFCNIGDQGHATGILELLNRYLPEARIIVWPRHETREVNGMLAKYWPDIRIVNARLRNAAGEDDDNGEPDNPEISKAAAEADFFLAGSGGGVMRWTRWLAIRYPNKPWGAYGITVTSPPTGATKAMMDRASFIFTRDTESLVHLRAGAIRCPIVEFGPDATFATRIEDEQRAVPFMQEHGLKPKEFICVIPRLRVTPYYRIPPQLRGTPDVWSPERIASVDRLNDIHKEKDHAKAREAMIAWVRRTGHPVLVCPEMYHNLELFDELLVDPLPPDVKKKVVKRGTFWMIDEASTVFKNAVAVLSFECHAPIIASHFGTPSFYLRQPEDNIKGQMWYDIGLSDWVFEIERTTGADITNRLMEVYNDYPKAIRHLELAMDYVRQRQRDTMMKVARSVGVMS